MAAKFTPERFVEVWMKSDSVKDVARTLRVSQPYVHQIATQLRKDGVRLKKMARGRQAKKIDVASLNQIVDKHAQPLNGTGEIIKHPDLPVGAPTHIYVPGSK